MNIKATPSRKPSITSALLSAVLEWFLMLLLYIDASVSYLVTSFARHCQLLVPCLLCSRLDHVLGKERAEFYWDLICQDHKLNISSLILCRLHNNLVDLRLTCESCFCSSKFEDSSYGADGKARRCVCCNKEGVLFPNKLTEFKLPEVENLNPRCNRDEVLEIDEGLSRLDYFQNYDEDPRPSVDGYTKVKVDSDIDSENQSPDNDVHNLIVEPITTESREFTVEQHLTVQDSILTGQRGSMSSEKLTNSEMSLNAIETADSMQKGCNDECGETSDSESKHQTVSKPIETETRSHKPELLDLSDAYKVAVGARLRQLSGKLLEQHKSMSESTKASEDLKLLLSQLSSSAARGFEVPPNGISPRASMNSEDSKSADASAFQLLQRRVSLERNESNLSLDGSIVSEIEGENPLDRLRRQVEHDKKVMSSLYKELEEERNASAVAANQAMAMITRLQEEKAALHMEALQYLRMMEEQAEYDCDALQKANDLLLERDKQLQDFESELEIYWERQLESDRLVGRTIALNHAKQFVIQHLKKLELKLSKMAECLPEETIDGSSPCKNLDYVMGSQESGRTEISKHDEEGLRKFDSGRLDDEDYYLSVLRHELSAMIKRLEAIDAS